MIPLETLRNWWRDSARVIQKAFPGMKIQYSDQWNIAWQRFEFAVVVHPPIRKPFYIAEYFTLKQLETEQMIVLEMMKYIPQDMIKKIRKELEV